MPTVSRLEPFTGTLGSLLWGRRDDASLGASEGGIVRNANRPGISGQ